MTEKWFKQYLYCRYNDAYLDTSTLATHWLVLILKSEMAPTFYFFLFSAQSYFIRCGSLSFSSRVFIFIYMYLFWIIDYYFESISMLQVSTVLSRAWSCLSIPLYCKFCVGTLFINLRDMFYQLSCLMYFNLFFLAWLSLLDLDETPILSHNPCVYSRLKSWEQFKHYLHSDFL